MFFPSPNILFHINAGIHSYVYFIDNWDETIVYAHIVPKCAQSSEII